jgi:cation diffusion facilitator CzcD-associated flavoprotein CzcO
MTIAPETSPAPAASPPEVLDALVVGAGITGLHMLHRLRESGVRAHIVEAGAGVGGTWFWNRYPGARFDSESYSYGYFFSQEIWDEWTWSEHFASQEETERYLNFAVDKLDLRRDITLGTRVESAQYDADAQTWSVQLDNGSLLRSQFLVTALGILSAPQYPPVPGRETFEGESYHTALWPSVPVELAGKRVAIIGTGSSGVQLIQEVGRDVAELVVLQRTPNWCTPLRNAPITPDEAAEIRGSRDEMYQKTQNQGGFIHTPLEVSAAEHSLEERRATYERAYAKPGFATLFGNYPDVIGSLEINAEFTEFLADKIRERIQDPALHDVLVPNDHGYGMKRPPMENGYYEVYNEPHVRLIDLRRTELEAITPSGLRTSEGDVEVDVIVYATGFDTITGAFDRIDFIGPDGQTLRDLWADGPHTFIGAGSPGFPNLVFVGGPQSIGGNIPRATERQVEFIAGLIDHVRASGAREVEVTYEAEQEWLHHVEETIGATIFSAGKDWSFGGNTPGKKVVYRNYAGGMLTFADKCSEQEANGYSGFTIR